MRIWVAVTLFVLVVLVVSNDVSARKSERSKSENKRSLAAEEASGNERKNDHSVDRGKKSKSVKSQDKSRSKRQRRSVDEVEPEVIGSKENSKKGSKSVQEKYVKKARSSDSKNRKSQKTEVPLKNKKVPKGEKKLVSKFARSGEKIGKSVTEKTVKKRSVEESVDFEETREYGKVSPSKVSTSKYSKRAKNSEKQENLNLKKNGGKKKVKLEKERSTEEAEPQENRRVKRKVEKSHQCGTGRRPNAEDVLLEKSKKNSSPDYETVELENEKIEAIVQSDSKDEEIDDEEEAPEEEMRTFENEETEVNEDEEVENEEAEEDFENEVSLGSCSTNENDETSEYDTDQSL